MTAVKAQRAVMIFEAKIDSAEATKRTAIGLGPCLTVRRLSIRAGRLRRFSGEVASARRDGEPEKQQAAWSHSPKDSICESSPVPGGQLPWLLSRRGTYPVTCVERANAPKFVQMLSVLSRRIFRDF